MTNVTTFAAVPEDGHSFWDYELSEQLEAAMSAATDEDSQAAHYLHLENGQVISGIRVEKEMLSDGSVVCTIYLKTS